MRKILQITLLALIACVYAASYTQQTTQNPTQKINAEINLGFDMDKVLQEIQEFTKIINLSGPKETLDDRATAAIRKLLSNLFYKIIGVDNISVINPTIKTLLKKNLPEANSTLISASVFTQDPVLAIDLFSAIYSSMEKKIPQEVKPVFNNLIKLGKIVTTSNDPTEKAVIQAIQRFIDQLNNIIATLRHSLETKKITTFDAPEILLPLDLAIDKIAPQIKKVIVRHSALVRTILNDAKRLTSEQLLMIDAAEKQIFKK